MPIAATFLKALKPAIAERLSEPLKASEPFESDAVNAVAISPDESRIASGGDGAKIHIWDVTNGSQIKVIQGHRHRSLRDIGLPAEVLTSVINTDVGCNQASGVYYKTSRSINDSM